MNMKLCTKLVLLMAVQGSVLFAGAEDLPLPDLPLQNSQVLSLSSKNLLFASRIQVTPDCINFPGPRPTPPPGNIKGSEPDQNK